MKNSSKLYGVMAAGGAIGLIASFVQTIEKLNMLKSGGPLVCDLNSVFSCTNVLNAWQSSLFGFPNSMMCMVFFTIFMTAGLAGLSGGKLGRQFRLCTQALSVFVLFFGMWFLWQSIYSIGALCVYCIFCFGGLLAVNWSWLRLNTDDLWFLGSANKSKLRQAIKSGADTFGWILIGLILAFMMLLKFG